MSENELAVKVAKYIVIGFVVLVASIMGSCQVTKYHIRAAIDNGTHPYLAECALSDVTCDRLLILELEQLNVVN